MGNIVSGQREVFEVWQRKGGFKRPDDPGEWEAYQAGAASQQARIEELETLVKRNAEQFAARHLGWDYLDDGTLVATYCLPINATYSPSLCAPRLYALQYAN